MRSANVRRSEGGDRVRRSLGHALVGLVFLSILPGCFATKGYPGPERPDEELIILTVDNESDWINLDDAYANGVNFGMGGIKLLPGKQEFSLNVDVKEPPENCHSYSSMNYSSYEECLKKRSGCDCFDYLSIYRRCDRRVRNGNCGGVVVGTAGKQYQVVLRRKGPHKVDSHIVERNSTKRAGQVSCDIYGAESTETEENYVGSGRSTAWSNGIYGCY